MSLGLLVPFTYAVDRWEYFKQSSLPTAVPEQTTLFSAASSSKNKDNADNLAYIDYVIYEPSPIDRFVVRQVTYQSVAEHMKRKGKKDTNEGWPSIITESLGLSQQELAEFDKVASLFKLCARVGVLVGMSIFVVLYLIALQTMPIQRPSRILSRQTRMDA